MTFQVSNLKDNYFLDLLDNNLYNTKPLYIKEGLQIKHFEHSNLLCIRATQAITNYAPIGEYHLRSFNCLYRSYPINQLVAFLEFNTSTFSFYKDITQCNDLLCSLQIQLLFCFIFYFFLFFVSSYVSSYKVATMDCHHILYNNFLIKKKLSINYSYNQDTLLIRSPDTVI